MSESMSNRVHYGASRRWVVKVGSSLVTNDGRGLDEQAISAWAHQMAALSQLGKKMVLVSSGAVAAGMVTLGWSTRPHALHDLQAAAAVGQMNLIHAYERVFATHGLHTAQVLLSYADLTDRQRYLNARSTLRTLLDLGIVPIVNENDTVSTEELRFGDNDTLASLVANLIEADLLVLLTDQAGLFSADPRSDPKAELIAEGRSGDPALSALATPRPGALGRGGMITKLGAAERAARGGAATIIASGRVAHVLPAIADGQETGTLLVPGRAPLVARKQWIYGHLKSRGELLIDAGAVRVLQEGGKSLLPVGITDVRGEFLRGDLVVCRGADGSEVARGLANYSASECRQIAGQPSGRIESILGYVDETEVIHRDNMVVA